MLETMIRVGLTGGIGSGKSTVAGLLAEHGALVIDADRMAREVVEPGQPALAEIAERFGSQALAADGSLDRSALAAIVFTDATALSDLNAITHPRIAQRTAELIEAAASDAVVVYDVPLLVETNAAEGWDAVIVVEADHDVRVRRLIERGLTEEDIEARMSRQATDEQRRAVADIVIVNSGDLGMLGQAVDLAWAQILATKRGDDD